MVTGPLFLPVLTPRGYQMGYPMIGDVPNLVAVPTHYFKVVLAESKSRNMLGVKPVRDICSLPTPSSDSAKAKPPLSSRHSISPTDLRCILNVRLH